MIRIGALALTLTLLGASAFSKDLASKPRSDYRCETAYQNIPDCGPDIKSGRCLEGTTLFEVEKKGREKYPLDSNCKETRKPVDGLHSVLCQTYYQVAACPARAGEACLDADRGEIRVDDRLEKANCVPATTIKD